MKGRPLTLILGNLDAWRLDQLAAVSPQLRLILRSRIIRNDLEPGEKISEPGLAKLYNVSRQPVREAFITLVNEGLLEIRPQRGTIVKRINYEAVLSGRFVREAVEADVVKMLSNNPNDALVADLRSQIEKQRDISRNVPEQFIGLDEKFHHTLADAAGLRRAWDFLYAIKAQMDRVRFISFEEFPIDKLIDQHAAIVDCIEQQNSDGAEQEMRNHLREILESLPKIRDMYPNYFA